MPYVERTPNGEITGAYTVPQSERSQELVSEDDPELIAFMNPPPPSMPDYISDFYDAIVGTPAEKASAKTRLRERGKP